MMSAVLLSNFSNTGETGSWEDRPAVHVWVVFGQGGGSPATRLRLTCGCLLFSREEAEARRLAEEEARRLAEEEARRLAEIEEARRRAEEEEARRRAEEEERLRRGTHGPSSFGSAITRLTSFFVPKVSLYYVLSFCMHAPL